MIRPKLLSLLVLLSLPTSATLSESEAFVVSDASRVEDVALRDRAYGDWNFGAGPFLEAGFMPGLYEIHHGASLIRFNLSGLECKTVTSARLRLYKPKDYVQMSRVTVTIHAVKHADRSWKEGGSECAPEEGAVTWNSQPRAGSLLAKVRAIADRGHWLEFPLPAALVQSWLDRSPADECLDDVSHETFPIASLLTLPKFIVGAVISRP